MQNNVSFRKDLIVGYLDSLTSFSYSEEFDRLFSGVENYLKEIIVKSKNRDLLERVRRIIEFKEKNKEIAM